MSDDRADHRDVEVGAEYDGVRLDSFLAAHLADRSRSQLQKLIKEGHVTGPIDGLKASMAVKTGQRFHIDLPEAGPTTAVAEDLPLTILYEDADVVVIDKAAGMVVHPAAGHSTGTVASGVMVAAKNDAAHQELSRQFHDREVEKEYIALVWGLVQAGRRIDAPIGRDPGDRQKMSTRARRARSAVTRVTRAENLRGVSLLQVAIATGRTHQIRVHLSAIGHPIVGDPTYGGVHRHVANDVRAVQRLERPFLHAWKLAFTHPTDGRRLLFESPLPADLQAVLDAIHEKQSDSEAEG